MKEKIRRVMQYLESQNLFHYPGGIPTSMKNSDQQWDGRYGIQYVCLSSYQNLIISLKQCNCIE